MLARPDWADKLSSAMRYEFGGHLKKSLDKATVSLRGERFRRRRLAESDVKIGFQPFPIKVLESGNSEQMEFQEKVDLAWKSKYLPMSRLLEQQQS